MIVEVIIIKYAFTFVSILAYIFVVFIVIWWSCDYWGTI